MTVSRPADVPPAPVAFISGASVTVEQELTDERAQKDGVAGSDPWQEARRLAYPFCSGVYQPNGQAAAPAARANDSPDGRARDRRSCEQSQTMHDLITTTVGGGRTNTAASISKQFYINCMRCHGCHGGVTAGTPFSRDTRNRCLSSCNQQIHGNFSEVSRVSRVVSDSSRALRARTRLRTRERFQNSRDTRDTPGVECGKQAAHQPKGRNQVSRLKHPPAVTPVTPPIPEVGA